MPLLQTRSLTAFYGSFQALFGVDISLDRGQTVAIVGANGAGKSTLMRSIVGLLPTRSDAVVFDGINVGGMSAEAIVRHGIAMVPEGRHLFASLTIEENLLIGAYARKVPGHWSLDTVYALFPVLKERRHFHAGALSGGQQQMVAIGRALMSNPGVLLCDELSLGLAPIIIKDIYKVISRVTDGGTSVILVEQDIGQALRVADYAYCLSNGRVTLEGIPDQLDRSAIHDAYFGVAL